MRKLLITAAVLLGAVLGGAVASAAATPLYASNQSSASVSPFAIQGDGSLLPIACVPLSNCSAGATSTPQYLAVQPSGRFLYVADNDANRVSVFAIAGDGSLSPLACHPAASCNTEEGPKGVAVDPLGRFLDVVNRISGSVSPFTIEADGTLAPIECKPASDCKTGGEPEGIAIAPSGKFLYVSNTKSNTISVFAIAADGSLSPIACKPAADCETGQTPVGVVVSPDGGFLYATNVNAGFNDISVFQINPDGSLTPTCNPSSSCAHTGNGPIFVAMDPNGRFLYTSNEATDDVSPFAVSPDGSLAPIACSPASNCKTGTSAEDIAVSPSGRFVYVSGGNVVVPFAIGAEGSLSPIACSPAHCATEDDPDGLAAAPDQGPVAALQPTVAPAGSPTTLDASASSDVDGQVVRYDWNLGDGTVLTNAGPSIQHSYAAAGSYTVSVTVTDDAGCSNAQTFTGQTVSCNGSAAATKTLDLIVPAPLPLVSPLGAVRPTVTRFAQSASRWAEGARLAKLTRVRKPPIGTTYGFNLNMPATVNLVFTHGAGGRKVGRRCVAQTKGNKHRRPCTRTIVAGAVKLAGHAGRDKVRFDGRLSRSHRLKLGRYTVTITATSALGEHSAPASLRFTIVKP